jgi:thiol-disulfide isomerase/thioredoxin
MRHALIALAIATAGCVTAGARPTSSAVGQPLDLAGPDLAGRQVRLADDAGKVRVVDFWATWCEPCREQLPLLDRLQGQYGPRGLSVYAVATDEERAAVEAFLAATPVTVKVLLDPGGETLARPLRIDRLPTTLLVDRKGVVRAAHLGYASGDGERLEDEVRKLLDE